MKKMMVVLAAIVGVISMSASVTLARPEYPGDVLSKCGTSVSCSFCHDNPSNYQAYSTSGACSVCPTAESCTTTPPDITCTDSDRDGFFAEAGCAQFYDCNDGNSGIYPGAIDVCNDGIDQDCSGADRKKGKGCRSRK